MLKFIGVVYLVLSLYLILGGNTDTVPTVEIRTQYVEVCDGEVFSEEALIQAIKKMKFKHPHVVLAQAKVETGHFKSNIFRENNNLFGMKVAWNRPTTAVGRNRGHAVYRNWRESLLDYALYSSYYTNHKTETELYAHLEDSYAEDPRYVKLLRAVVEREDLKQLF